MISMRLGAPGSLGRNCVSPGISPTNNLADPGPVESLVALVALEDLQVRAERTMLGKSFGLLAGDKASCLRGRQPTGLDHPGFALRENLPQVGEFGKRLHRHHALASQLGASRLEVKLRFKVVHSCLQQGLAVQLAPQSDSSP